MFVIVKVKDTDNIIGLKEDIATRLEGVVDIERIDVLVETEPIQIKTENFCLSADELKAALFAEERRKHHARP